MNNITFEHKNGKDVELIPGGSISKFRLEEYEDSWTVFAIISGTATETLLYTENEHVAKSVFAHVKKLVTEGERVIVDLGELASTFEELPK